MAFAQPAHPNPMHSPKSHLFDKFAIFLSVTCAIHCLLVPILIIFPTDRRHHLLCRCRLPSLDALSRDTNNGYRRFMGCKKHKDKIVITLSALGILIVTASTIYQYSLQSDTGACVICASGGHSVLNPSYGSMY